MICDHRVCGLRIARKEPNVGFSNKLSLPCVKLSLYLKVLTRASVFVAIFARVIRSWSSFTSISILGLEASDSRLPDKHFRKLKLLALTVSDA